MGENFEVSWNTYTSHGKELFKDLLETGKFSDVTIVSDDEQLFQAHRFILSSCSSMFQKILKNSPENATIYLRGISQKDIQSLLQFMYLGKAIINKARIDEFLNVARDLKIKEIGEDDVDVDDNQHNVEEDMFNNEMDDAVDPLDDDIKFEPALITKTDDGSIFQKPLNLKGDPKLDSDAIIKSEDVKIDQDTIVKTEDNLYACPMCDKKLATIHGIERHIKSFHYGIMYNCPHCDFQATQLSSVNQHIKYKHEGRKFPCQLCEHQAPTKSNLKKHYKSMHSSSIEELNLIEMHSITQ